MKDAVEELAQAKKKGERLTPRAPNNSEYIPFRLSKHIEPGQAFGTLKGEVIAGRGLWLFSMKHTLTRTLNVLHQHRWSILKPPEGLNWFTSDDPVVRLNFYQEGKYHFNGGWGNAGTEILLPLSPRHLLYTRVGERPPQRGAKVERSQAEMIRRFIAEHAHRMIIAASPDEDIQELRPRTVSIELCQSEAEQWRKWHHEQTIAEQEMLSGR